MVKKKGIIHIDYTKNIVTTEEFGSGCIQQQKLAPIFFLLILPIMNQRKKNQYKEISRNTNVV